MVVVVVSSLEGPGFLFRVRQTATSVNLVNSAVCVPKSSPLLLRLDPDRDRSNSSVPLSTLFPLSYLPPPYRGIKIQLTFDYGFRGAAISLE